MRLPGIATNSSDPTRDPLPIAAWIPRSFLDHFLRPAWLL
jgi:hypothetical protein